MRVPSRVILPVVFPVLAALATIAPLSGCDKVKVITQRDAGPVCDATEELINGECRVVCHRDGDCATGQRCDLLTGTCEPKPPPVDSGVVVVPCSEGAVRCAANNASVERCDATGHFVTSEQCVQPEGYCQNEVCLRCRPGATRCTSSGSAVEICLDDGSDYRQVACAAGATCAMGQCAECTVGQKRCSTDMKSLEECQRLPREDLSAGWVAAGDNFDGTCVTQVCEMGTSGPQCRAPACLPGATRCANMTTQQVCSATGTYTDVLCSSLPGMSPAAECVNGTCVDECADAARQRSYFGCEYWTTVLENDLPPSLFKGGLTGIGYGTADSEFAFVIANRSTQPATVTISKSVNNVETTVKTVTVPGRNDPATKGVAQIKVPWAHTSPGNGTLATTGRLKTGYHVKSSRPVTAYQFNPLSAVVKSGSCNNVNQCNAVASGSGQQCIASQCNYFSFSNDASLLLPAHILGTSYLGLTMEHIAFRPTTSGAPQNFSNGSLTIIGTQDATQVTVKSTAKTLGAADGGYPAMAAGESRTLTLNAFEVLTISTDLPAAVVNGTTTGNLECGNNPFDQSISCLLGSCTQVCRVAQGDLTGTVVLSDKPVAVFGGAACTMRGYRDPACDHVEEQLFPFVTWGQNFVASRTAPLRLTDNTFASAANAGPDYYKIVAGCSDTASGSPCPNGTTITLSAPPAAGDVLSNAGGCEPGTSLTANNCRLRGGRFVEFRSKTSFTIGANQPIQVAQIFAGEEATAGTTRPAQGDPSLVLLPPIEQWRSSYTVLTAPGTRDNYLGIVMDSARVSQVKVDGAPVTTGWVSVGATSFRTNNIAVAVGSHTIDIVPLPNQMTIPGAGVTVYGFDQYVSYGYTGGLDLTSIVTGVTPGG